MTVDKVKIFWSYFYVYPR